MASCAYCLGEIETARAELGLTCCLSCAKKTVKKVSDFPVRMERMFNLSEKDQEVDDVNSLAKVLDF